jgi:hypothetical protein
VKRYAVLLALAVCGTAQAQRVAVTDVGPGASGRILQQVIARPHRLVEPDTSWFVLRRGEQERTTLLILGRTAGISGKVEGDVVVVGGDLHIRPGAQISGSAIAIGGGTYVSSLAIVSEGTLSFFDNTFAIEQSPDGGYTLSYQSMREHDTPPLVLPGVYGIRAPSYDRVNGVSVRFGPTFTFADGRGEIDGIATYRSDLGKVDPSIDGTLQLTRRLWVGASAARGTFSNDEWIWPTLLNSVSVLAFGADTRNYYRADRAQATAHQLWELRTLQLEPFVGVRGERAWSVGPGRAETSHPWSLLARTDTFGIRRPNPEVDSTTTISMLAGTVVDWVSGDVRLRTRTAVEHSLDASRVPGPVETPASFTQVTTDGKLAFLTFRDQEYAVDLHWVTTLGDVPPRQRFVYFGGSGTIPFLELLEQGGDELLLIDQRYSIPIPNVRLGLLGMPTLQLRHRMGGAGLSKLPSLEQVIGVGVMMTFVRAELQMDPKTRKLRFSAGFSFSR